VKRLAMVTTVTLLVSACGQKGAIEDQVRGVLKDPDSAKIKVELVKGQGDNLLACGVVNAKNGFGGYTGDEPFMIWQGSVLLPRESQDSIKIASCCMFVATLHNTGKVPFSEKDFGVMCSGMATPFNFSKPA
jgi:hypothetical protein